MACTALPHLEERLIVGSALRALGLSCRASAGYFFLLLWPQKHSGALVTKGVFSPCASHSPRSRSSLRYCHSVLPLVCPTYKACLLPAPQEFDSHLEEPKAGTKAYLSPCIAHYVFGFPARELSFRIRDPVIT